MALLNEPVKPVHAFNPLVQISTDNAQMEETRA
jgi:type IV secretory pathway TraG/TraD family ATPase VirD4